MDADGLDQATFHLPAGTATFMLADVESARLRESAPALVCTGIMFGGVAALSARAGAGTELIAAGWSGLFIGLTLAAVPSVVMALGVTLGAQIIALSAVLLMQALRSK